jgi:hypothetical protein
MQRIAECWLLTMRARSRGRLLFSHPQARPNARLQIETRATIAASVRNASQHRVNLLTISRADCHAAVSPLCLQTFFQTRTSWTAGSDRVDQSQQRTPGAMRRHLIPTRWSRGCSIAHYGIGDARDFDELFHVVDSNNMRPSQDRHRHRRGSPK